LIACYISIYTYVPITQLRSDLLNGFSNEDSQNLTAQVSGVYQASASASILKGTVSSYGMKLFINGVGQDKCYSNFDTTATTGGTPSFTCFISLEVGDVVYVGMDDHTNPVNDPTLGNFNLNLVRMGNL